MIRLHKQILQQDVVRILLQRCVNFVDRRADDLEALLDVLALLRREADQFLLEPFNHIGARIEIIAAERVITAERRALERVFHRGLRNHHGLIILHRQVSQARRCAYQQYDRCRLGEHRRPAGTPRRRLRNREFDVRPQVALRLYFRCELPCGCRQFVVAFFVHASKPCSFSCWASNRLARCSCALLVPTAMPSMSLDSSWL